MPSPTSNASSTAAFLSGKVAIEDGSELTDPAAVQLICRGQRRTAGYTDRKGSFSFQLADPASAAADLSDASTTIGPSASSSPQANWQDCEVQAVLAGYSSEVVELASRMNALESVDLGTITLHRLAHVEGTSISVTSLLAPMAAKKALERAREDEKKGKWDQAQQSLQKAVRIYPKYAVAWSELGRVQMRLHDLASAKKSFAQSLAADSKYVNAYDGLAQLAFAAKQWPEVIETTKKLLALNPVNFPAAYFFNGAAQYQQGELDAAEKITRDGVRVDDGHQVPKLQYLLGMILVRKHQYREASEQLQQYLGLVKQPAQVEEAKKELAEIARLSALR
ncbi:MAG TPA: tetratricopeptide repeat protein [Terriglobales bacterium]|nr:tetratricopeptide repeat protein [Terriglobales bacterium]